MLYNANPILAAPGETVLVTKVGNQRLSAASLHLGVV
jgi:hypothetical protein